MPRRTRIDSPGAWHHVMNRGIARRTVFEDRASVRYFLANLARAVRAGDLEVHVFAVMATHFHLLVRSPRGKLSNAMQRIQNLYVRWFNRRARRDGPLFRGRFLSLPVEGLRYRRVLVRYIDQNPVEARMVDAPEHYAHGSARHYATLRGPRWLDRSWVEEDTVLRTGASRFSLDAYRRAFGESLPTSERAFVEARIEHPSSAPDPLEDLVHSAPENVGRWMRRKAALADGTRPGLPCVSVDAVLSACDASEARRPEWRLRRGKAYLDAWPVLRVAMLRDLASLSWEQISRVTSTGLSSVRRRYASHRAWVETDEGYQELLSCVSHRSLRG